MKGSRHQVQEGGWFAPPPICPLPPPLPFSILPQPRSVKEGVDQPGDSKGWQADSPVHTLSTPHVPAPPHAYLGTWSDALDSVPECRGARQEVPAEHSDQTTKPRPPHTHGSAQCAGYCPRSPNQARRPAAECHCPPADTWPSREWAALPPRGAAAATRSACTAPCSPA